MKGFIFAAFAIAIVICGLSVIGGSIDVVTNFTAHIEKREAAMRAAMFDSRVNDVILELTK